MSAGKETNRAETQVPTPEYCKVKVRKKLYAAVYLQGKTIYLGAYGSPESRIAYTRFVAEHKANYAPYLPENKESITVKELVISFIDHVEGTISNAVRHSLR